MALAAACVQPPPRFLCQQVILRAQRHVVATPLFLLAAVDLLVGVCNCLLVPAWLPRAVVYLSQLAPVQVPPVVASRCHPTMPCPLDLFRCCPVLRSVVHRASFISQLVRRPVVVVGISILLSVAQRRAPVSRCLLLLATLAVMHLAVLLQFLAAMLRRVAAWRCRPGKARVQWEAL